MADETPDTATPDTAPEDEAVYVVALPDEFVRAKHSETGHLAALGRAALAAGMHPGWSETEGPVPDRPKPAVFRKPPPAPKTADSSSAKKKEE